MATGLDGRTVVVAFICFAILFSSSRKIMLSLLATMYHEGLFCQAAAVGFCFKNCAGGLRLDRNEQRLLFLGQVPCKHSLDAVRSQKDEYGGSPKNRSRFLFEVVDSVLGKVDAQRVGVKISPMHEGDAFQANDETLPVTEYEEAECLQPFTLIVDGEYRRFFRHFTREIGRRWHVPDFRPLFKGTLIAT
jgi:hypothetical protein